MQVHYNVYQEPNLYEGGEIKPSGRRVVCEHTQSAATHPTVVLCLTPYNLSLHINHHIYVKAQQTHLQATFTTETLISQRYAAPEDAILATNTPHAATAASSIVSSSRVVACAFRSMSWYMVRGLP